jgi:hypothetical protein
MYIKYVCNTSSNCSNPFSLSLNVLQILKTKVGFQFWDISILSIWFMIDPFGKQLNSWSLWTVEHPNKD